MEESGRAVQRAVEGAVCELCRGPRAPARGARQAPASPPAGPSGAGTPLVISFFSGTSQHLFLNLRVTSSTFPLI